ncbi:tRNA (adenosine(37)-N6)-threonylcarbamoyltransferase complex dimerization subunit type 1 TsaB [Microlunatus soli]|uniref:tRNA threonylcarbamoyl adenosine modification protein YeaZ n=1 Tax=Microlunatus soli TaxID=630515 RepID=A0A1H1WXR0_9ACTN|nr:tRNA (adenosine(37)-N6)-threonylcarbamoyltransferase complex dimerization subunit type 1 TsaB [Microlunatus soli]SDT01136.1 tRNA threonylcarbamoyl adenosine modification protein YeaZ [Microlunatus soli]
MAEQLILGLDTATLVQVGLSDGADVLASRTFDDPRRHVEQLAPLIAETAAGAGVSLSALTKIIVGLGPGPYTGLRVGIATARTLGAALGVEVRGVCSLDGLAAQWLAAEQPPTGEFLIATDARRREVYWAQYGADGVRIAGPSVGSPADLPDLPLGGPAGSSYPELPIADGAPTRLDAGVLASAGTRLPDAGIEPLYLRSPDATPPGPRKSVLPKVLP